MERDQDKDKIVDLYIERLVQQNIRIAAITDYNGIRIEWFNRIREKAREKGIVIFPGAELSFAETGKYGLHIIAVFPLNADVKGINRAIYSLDREPSKELIGPDGQHRDIMPNDHVAVTLKRLRRELNAILIISHPNDTNGLFKSLRPQDAAQFLKDVEPDAIENLREQDISRLISTGLFLKEDLKRVASVEFTDPKSIDDIGAKTRPDGLLRATYLKLSDFEDLDAIRLALHDPEVRLRIGGQIPTYDYTRLLSVEIQGSGFCGGLQVNLSPELNTIIGGRGVGKSAFLELVRYALDIEPFFSSDYRQGLLQHALRSGGKVVLNIERVFNPSVRRIYRIERVWAEPPRVFELTSDQQEEEVELSPRDVLGDGQLPLFFGQREIYEITRDETKRLRLLDDIVGRTTLEKRRILEELKEKLRQNARELIYLTNQLANKEEVQNRLREVEHQIDLYEREGLADKLREITFLDRDEERLKQIEIILPQVRKNWTELQGSIVKELERVAQQTREAESARKQLVEDAGCVIKELHSTLVNLLQQGAEEIAKTEDCLNDILKIWKEARRSIDEDLQRIKQELGTHSLDPDQLKKLTIEQMRCRKKLEDLDDVEKKLKEKLEDRKHLLRNLRDIRYEMFQLRQQRAKELSDRLKGRVRVEIIYKGQIKEFAEQLRNLLNGSRVESRSITRICEKESVDGYQIALAVREQKVAEEFGITNAQALRMSSWFEQNPEALYELELLIPEDLVTVYLSLDDKEIPLEKLSDGQRATAIILLLLTLEERWLMVDQPEDDLDNRFIYDDIVRLLRDQKNKRQIIVVTHNPNVPVLGDAELIIALEALENKARIVNLGSVDKKAVREIVKHVMEGGEEAFHRRAEKYGWPF
ncbi:AAA family ATPase [Desulfofundulus thermocisternus]|nr:AAA family ATPase [Desulfofundulus thermocisternus]